MSEYGELLNRDMAELSTKLHETLQRENSLNMRGIAALLQLASVLMATSIPTKEDHEIAELSVKMLGKNHLAMVALVSSMSRAMVMSYYGMTKGIDGQV